MRRWRELRGIAWLVERLFAAKELALSDSASLPPHTFQPAEPTAPAAPHAADAEELARRKEESRLLRRLQFMMSLTMQTIAQTPGLRVEEASQMIADARHAALSMFPGKELAYDLIWRPRFQRLMRERFRIM